MYDLAVSIKFFERAKPQILLDIDTNCEVYSVQDSQIIVTVDISNEGDAEIENVTVTIDPGDLSVIKGDCTAHFNSLLELVGGEYLFSWNKVPGKHDDLLLNYLGNDLVLDWITKDTYISKTPDDKTISVSGDGNLVEITLIMQAGIYIFKDMKFGIIYKFNYKPYITLFNTNKIFYNTKIFY